MYFWDEVNEMRESIGEQYYGAPVQNAYCIEISQGIASIASRLDFSTPSIRFTFKDIDDAFPPLTGLNLFVEFETGACLYWDDSFSRIGLHLVNWSICHKPLSSFQTFPEIDNSEIEEIYGAAVYNKYVSPVCMDNGARISLGKKGELEQIYFFRSCPRKYYPRERQQDLERKLHHYLYYLTFATFSEINAGRLKLRQIEDKKFLVI